MDDSTTYYIIAFVVLFILIFLALYVLYYKRKRAAIYAYTYKSSPKKQIDWREFKRSDGNRHLIQT